MVPKVMAVAISPNSVQVSWDNTIFNNITEFVIYYKLNENESQAEMTQSVPYTQNTANINNLNVYANYTIEVVAKAMENGRAIFGLRSNSITIQTLNETISTTSNMPTGDGNVLQESNTTGKYFSTYIFIFSSIMKHV